ncbi:MAG TPA: hypothetical protein VN282_06735 [Pyrinomonadaceae bacterium]|nr:hypothetical protein [Pyrinomonadaceae bacterium]
MKQTHAMLLIIAVTLFVLAFPAGAAGQGRVGSGYKLTIFVDEGRGELNGHVFVGLTAGETTVYAGFYAKDKSWGKPLLKKGGGEVRNDAERASGCEWDVKQTYNISRAGYENALKAVLDWENEGLPWALSHHCGDFAETVARMAGVDVRLGQHLTGRNRPGLFGEYLRDNGGEVSVKAFDVNNRVGTNIYVGRGDRVLFGAAGSVLLGPNVGESGPEGITHFLLGILPVRIDPIYSPFPEIPHGSLLGRIRTPGAGKWTGWFVIGAGGEMIATNSGVLELDVNDNVPEDNRGRFRVGVKVCKAQ